ncbi:MAG: acetyl-CoA C-acetyltransferase [Gammaproteobacteria bacterium]|jgi:acetyl-CoA C-acetyltransferase
MATAQHSSEKAPPVYVVDGSRTPFLKARSGPGPFRPSDLAVHAALPLLARQTFEATQLDEVILGCIGPTPDEVNIGRVVALRIGCGDKVPAWTVQRNCASGMQAIDSGVRSIITGRANLVLAGGTEAMSHAPILWGPEMVAWFGQWMGARTSRARLKALLSLRPAYLKPVIAILRGLTDPVVGLSMGQTAEVLAHRFAITRTQMDEYAVRSHQRLADAQASGKLAEIVPLVDATGTQHTYDDGVRPDSAVDKLAKLKPVFDKEFGHVTAGNSAQITDGAAWVILASEHAVKSFDLPVLGRIVDTEWAGLDPRQMGLGPVHASAPLLHRRRVSIDKIDYWEINEAFGAQVLACLAAFKDKDYCKAELGLRNAMGEIDEQRLNVDGGAVALGHPVGTSGARIVLHLLHVLNEHKAKRGIAAICIGGGQGGAMMVERL